MGNTRKVQESEEIWIVAFFPVSKQTIIGDFASKGLWISPQRRKRMDTWWCKGCRNDHQAHLQGSVTHHFGNIMKQAHLPNYNHRWCFPQCCPSRVSHHTWQITWCHHTWLNPWCQVLSSVSQRQSRWALATCPWSVQQRLHCLIMPIGKKWGFSFSLSFCLFLNVPRLAQHLAHPACRDFATGNARPRGL